MFIRPSPFEEEPPRRRISARRAAAAAAAFAGSAAAALVAVHLVLAAVSLVRGCGGKPPRPERQGPSESGPGFFSPVREAPASFPRNSKMPGPSERDASGGIDLDSFSAARDLVYVDDPRCWWESDNDAAENDVECDHSMHAAMELPFRRLVNLVAAAEGTNSQLRVQEAYRPSGIHSARSLHCEGRALDVTLGRPGARDSFRGAEGAAALERLAKLCWQAGFDWVYFEQANGTGPHVHASVRRAAPRLSPPPTGLRPEAAPPSGPTSP